MFCRSILCIVFISLCFCATSLQANRSWVESANGDQADFGLDNLPYGVFETKERGARIGVAIGDEILDLWYCVERGLLRSLHPNTRKALQSSNLNRFLGLGPEQWAAARSTIQDILHEKNVHLARNSRLRALILVPRHQATLLLPAEVGDFTDFFASKHHATRMGALFFPNQPLTPNYKHLPIAYHGRASTVVASGTPVQRPSGQQLAAKDKTPHFGPVKKLDYEMEMGVLIGPSNVLGQRIPLETAERHLFGLVIVNDWSARDVQGWEGSPLGPFNGKNFLTSVSPWVVPLAALEPYRVSGPQREADDPEPLDYLKAKTDAAFDITVDVYLCSAKMRGLGMAPLLLSRGNMKDLYWTLPQMLVHHSSTGCQMRPGDLIASGTISGASGGSEGCLMELTQGGQAPVILPDGSTRSFLEDGDEVILKAYAEQNGRPRISFGECRGLVVGTQ